MPQSLAEVIENVAMPKQMPDGSLEPTLTVSQIETLSLRFNMEAKAVEIAALEDGIFPERYARNFRTYAPADQIRLLQSRVTVVGLGGLGGTLTESLARSGVGHMNLIDGDRFEDHNLNRQLFCTQDRIGTAKAVAAAERVCRINNSVTVQSHSQFLDAKNAASLLNDCHVVVDCLDNIASRFVLEAAAKSAGIPMVSAAVAGLSGHITTILPEDEGLELIYGPPQTLEELKGAEKTLGCLPQAVIHIAAAESAEVIKVLLGRNDNLLRDKLLMIDMDANTYETLRLK